MSYNFLEHTADVKFQASGSTLEEAFLESAQALLETIKGNIEILEQQEKQIKINGKDLESLLYGFLEEIIVVLDSEEFLVSKIKDLEIDKSSFILKATLTGDKASNYHFTNDVKAVTYNNMFVKQDDKTKEWTCQVVLDV